MEGCYRSISNALKRCHTKYCRKNPGNRRYCSTCRSKIQKRDRPFLYYYDRLKGRARERGKEFNLCLEQFMLIWLCEPEKWAEKLAKKESPWQMDRIDNRQGYHFDNIQIISKRRNIQKYYNEDRKFTIDAVWIKDNPVIDEEVPF